MSGEIGFIKEISIFLVLSIGLSVVSRGWLPRCVCPNVDIFVSTVDIFYRCRQGMADKRTEYKRVHQHFYREMKRTEEATFIEQFDELVGTTKEVKAMVVANGGNGEKIQFAGRQKLFFEDKPTRIAQRAQFEVDSKTFQMKYIANEISVIVQCNPLDNDIDKIFSMTSISDVVAMEKKFVLLSLASVKQKDLLVADEERKVLNLIK